LPEDCSVRDRRRLLQYNDMRISLRAKNKGGGGEGISKKEKKKGGRGQDCAFNLGQESNTTIGHL